MLLKDQSLNSYDNVFTELLIQSITSCHTVQDRSVAGFISWVKALCTVIQSKFIFLRLDSVIAYVQFHLCPQIHVFLKLVACLCSLALFYICKH